MLLSLSLIVLLSINFMIFTYVKTMIMLMLFSERVRSGDPVPWAPCW